MGDVNKDIKNKKKKIADDDGYNILRIFNTFLNFLFIKSDAKCGY